MENEIWKDIPGYEGKYQASNHGNVRGLDRKVGFRSIKGKVLKPVVNSVGYSSVTLVKKVHNVHRLVMLSFIGFSNLQVNHINGIKTDNRLENLEYCTCKENIQHSFRLGLSKGSRHFLGRTGALCHNSKKVLQMDMEGNIIKEWGAVKEASTELGIHSISNVCIGERKSAGGFTWKYI